MLKGRISSCWGRAMIPAHKEQFSERKTLNSTTFQVRLIRGLWNIFEGIWQQRNAIANNATNSTKEKNVNRKVQEFYRRRIHLVSHDDLSLFTMFQQDQVTEMPLFSKATWIRQVELAIKSRHGKLHIMKRPINTITNYFQRRNSPFTPSFTDQNTQDAQEG